MTPTKAKKLIPKTAELTGFSEEIVNILVSFYYKQLREKLSYLQYPAIQVEGFGNFYIKEKALERTHQRYLRFENGLNNKPEGPRKESMSRDIVVQLERFERIKKLLEERKQKKEFVTLHQETYEEAKRNLEE